MADGSAIVLTSALLWTGQDESFDQVGVIPNVELEAEGVTAAMLLMPAPQIDPQVIRAFEIARAMVRERTGLDPGSALGPAPDASASSAP